MTRILGIDPGTRVAGYGLLDAGGVRSDFRYLECGVLSVKPEGDIGLRIHDIASGLREVIEEFQPTEAAIESAFHGLNASSSLKLAEARGALREICYQAGLSVFEYAPTKIKRAVVGQGRATKADVQARIGLLCGLDPVPKSDAADALAIAICHAQSRRFLPSALASISKTVVCSD